MDVLIIGGSGFVSGTLARTALATGHRVWTLTRGQRPVPEGAVPLVADRHDVDAFADAVAGAATRWDLAVDCIAYGPEDIRQDVAVLADRADQFVFVSTDFVFDPSRRAFPQPEQSDHYLPPGSYGGNKRAAELELARADTRAMAWTIVRPCHIHGPGSRLGCLPLHVRDPDLVEALRAGRCIRLVGGGHFLQQPIYAPDLARLILSTAGNARASSRTFNTAGPDIVESRQYYQIVARALQTEVHIEEEPVDAYLRDHPEGAPFLCHRIYDLSPLRRAGLAVPDTPLVEGLRRRVESLPA